MTFNEAKSKLIRQLKNDDEQVTRGEFGECLANCRVQGEPWVTKAGAITEMFAALDHNENNQLDTIEFTMRLPENHDEL